MPSDSSKIPNPVHRVELAAYGAILIVTPCPRGRMGPALGIARQAIGPIFDESPLSTDTRLNRIAIFLAVNGSLQVQTFDRRIRNIKETGRTYMIDVVIPPSCLTEPDDVEYAQIVECTLLAGLVIAARKLGHDDAPFLRAITARAQTPRVAALFSAVQWSR